MRTRVPLDIHLELTGIEIVLSKGIQCCLIENSDQIPLAGGIPLVS